MQEQQTHVCSNSELDAQGLAEGREFSGRGVLSGLGPKSEDQWPVGNHIWCRYQRKGLDRRCGSKSARRNKKIHSRGGNHLLAAIMTLVCWRAGHRAAARHGFIANLAFGQTIKCRDGK